MTIPLFSPKEWSLEYRHGKPRHYIVKSGEQKIVEITTDETQNEDETIANVHLIASAPKLYKALKELLLSTEDALMSKNIGCECERCNLAKVKPIKLLVLLKEKLVSKKEILEHFDI